MSWHIWESNSILLSEVAMRRSDLVQTETKGSTPRTTQIVFGERQHLLRVLDSLETTTVPQVRLNQERRVIEELIHERTKELNHINSSWDEKVGLVLNADSKADMLDKLAREAPESDYYLLRLDRKSTRLNSSHSSISYAVFCLKKKKK